MKKKIGRGRPSVSAAGTTVLRVVAPLAWVDHEDSQTGEEVEGLLDAAARAADTTRSEFIRVAIEEALEPKSSKQLQEQLADRILTELGIDLSKVITIKGEE